VERKLPISPFRIYIYISKKLQFDLNNTEKKGLKTIIVLLLC